MFGSINKNYFLNLFWNINETETTIGMISTYENLLLIACILQADWKQTNKQWKF